MLFLLLLLLPLMGELCAVDATKAKIAMPSENSTEPIRYVLQGYALNALQRFFDDGHHPTGTILAVEVSTLAGRPFRHMVEVVPLQDVLETQNESDGEYEDFDIEGALVSRLPEIDEEREHSPAPASPHQSIVRNSVLPPLSPVILSRFNMYMPITPEAPDYSPINPLESPVTSAAMRTLMQNVGTPRTPNASHVASPGLPKAGKRKIDEEGEWSESENEVQYVHNVAIIALH